MSDLISRQAAIDAMCVVNDSICGQQAIDALCELPSVQSEQRWIPVSERLPEPNEEVLVYLRGNLPYLAYVNRKGRWEIDFLCLDADDAPKAWMPLPKPWKGENND